MEKTTMDTTTESPDLALEREKIQIERERLALERERWETERESYRQTVTLSNRAAGRLTIPVSTLILSLITAFLLGGIGALWITSGRRADSGEIAATACRPTATSGPTRRSPSSAATSRTRPTAPTSGSTSPTSATG